MTKRSGTTVLTESYTYKTNSDGSPTGQIATCQTQSANYSVTYTYTYDDNGNILSVSDGTYTTTYVYDSANQLIRENNQAEEYTHTWTYDNAGNILSRKQYAYSTGTLGAVQSTVNYTYSDSGWGDLLTAYDGTALTYDAIGNPLSDGTWSYTWQSGRELASMSNGSTTWTNTYNADGLRTKRTNGTSTYSYVYNGSSLVQMTVDGSTLYFTYDASGTPQTVTYNGTTYYYATNLQGDITAILNASGTTVVSYTYDAWGNHTSGYNGTGTLATTLGKHNPLRYRGYVFDVENGLYYLQSRYYNPAIGRFINADAYAATGQGLLGNNMFAYCLNNPINYIDRIGMEPVSITLLLGYYLAVAVISVVGFSIVLSPQFQQAWSNMCNSALRSLRSGLEALGDITYDFLCSANSTARKIAKSIADSYAAAKTASSYKSPREEHHIVAKKAPNASYAREILDAVGIGYNSNHNLVSLKTGLHRRLHTNLYYGWANSIVIASYHSANGDEARQRENVLAALNIIRAFLLSMDQVAPY